MQPFMTVKKRNLLMLEQSTNESIMMTKRNLRTLIYTTKFSTETDLNPVSPTLKQLLVIKQSTMSTSIY